MFMLEFAGFIILGAIAVLCATRGVKMVFTALNRLFDKIEEKL